MSWIIQSLLNNRDRIKETGDIESDDFNDLLVIEKAIKELVEKGLLTSYDLDVIGMGTPIIASTHNEKYTLNKKKSIICTRIGYYLGGYFTDEGYLNYIAQKHNLNTEQLAALRTYIASEYKQKTIRKPLYANNTNI